MALGGTVRGKVTTLRMPVEDDLPAYARWMADLRVRRQGNIWHEPAMPGTWRERLADAAKGKDSVLWSVAVQGRLVGTIRAHFDFPPIAEGVELRHFIIDPDEWRKGYGSDAALALHRYLFDYLHIRWVDAEFHADNAAGLRIADRLGYREYARGHAVHYAEGAYVDQSRRRMDLDTWEERWGPAEREYPPLSAQPPV